jgi:hypothetical protein
MIDIVKEIKEFLAGGEPSSAVQKLQKLLAEPEISTLIVDDDKVMQEGFEIFFKDLFPNTSSPYSYEGFGVDEHTIEDIIEKGKYFLHIVDGRLAKWEPHPVFGQSGPELVAFIREKRPNSFVISVSMQTDVNALAVKKGADFSVDKGKLTEFANAVTELKKNISS